MVSWLPTVLVPGLFALAFLRRLPRKWVIACAPIAWVPDLDYISNMLGLEGHRVLTHNIWIPLAFLGLSYLAWRRAAAKVLTTNTPATYLAGAVQPGWALFWLLASFYWASHVFLDVFAGGALLLWPLSNLNFYLFYEIHVDLQSGEVTPVAEGGTEVGPPELSSDYAWLTYEHTAILAFLAVALLCGLGWRMWSRRRGRKLVPDSPSPSTKGK